MAFSNVSSTRLTQKQEGKPKNGQTYIHHKALARMYKYLAWLSSGRSLPLGGEAIMSCHLSLLDGRRVLLR